MNTITTHATATAHAPILAIDLGKYKSVVCLFRSPNDVWFTSVPTTRAPDISTVLAELQAFGSVRRCDPSTHGMSRREFQKTTLN